jgi:hypothetical protein
MWNPFKKKILIKPEPVKLYVEPFDGREYSDLLVKFVATEFRGNLKDKRNFFSPEEAEELARQYRNIWDTYVPDTQEGTNMYVHPFRNQRPVGPS